MTRTEWLLALCAVSGCGPTAANKGDEGIDDAPSEAVVAWAVQGGGAVDDQGVGVSSLEDGTVVVAGTFRGDADFDTRKESTLSASGPNDGFVARYGMDGDLEWLTRAGGDSQTEYDFASTVAALPDGGFVVAGSFSGAATFGAGGAQTTLVSAGPRDVFVARYQAAGQLSWVKQAGGLCGSIVTQLTALSSGQLVLVGFLTGPTVFGNGEANETTLTPVGLAECMIAQFDGDGDLLWAQLIQGTTDGGNVCSGTAASTSGQIAVTGSFDYEVVLGSGGGVVLDSVGGSDVFIAAYDVAGGILWARSSGGSDDDLGHGIAACPGESWLITGTTAGTAVFGAGEPEETSLTTRGETDLFLANYDGDGTLTWVRQAGGSSADVGYGLVSLANGAILLTGFFSGTASFGDVADATVVETAGAEDIFLARFDEAGALVSVHRAGGLFADHAFGVAATESGDALVTGYFSDAATFFPGTAFETTLTSRGGTDIFVARMPR